MAEDGGGNCLVVHGQQAEGEAEGGVPLRNFVTVIPLPVRAGQARNAAAFPRASCLRRHRGFLSLRRQVDTYRAATLRGAHWRCEGSLREVP